MDCVLTLPWSVVQSDSHSLVGHIGAIVTTEGQYPEYVARSNTGYYDVLKCTSPLCKVYPLCSVDSHRQIQGGG